LTGAWGPAAPPALGVWVKLPVPEVLEVLAGSGPDFVVLDCEHGPFDRRTMSTMVGVARGLGLRVFVRVPGHSPPDLQAALDAGVDGVFVPHVDDARMARWLVDTCRFPPLGGRAGSPATRAGNWGRGTTAQYVARGNAEVTLVAQIESPAAVAAAGDIAQVAGLDAVFVGPFDLALSSGLAPGDPAFRAMVSNVEAAARGIALGGVAGSVPEADELAARGYAFLMIGADTSFLAAAAGSLVDQIRETTTSQPEGIA
jgi:2-keto-3-deoxy-L-rhamnonate aldolase RhmA